MLQIFLYFHITTSSLLQYYTLNQWICSQQKSHGAFTKPLERLSQGVYHSYWNILDSFKPFFELWIMILKWCTHTTLVCVSAHKGHRQGQENTDINQQMYPCPHPSWPCQPVCCTRASNCCVPYRSSVCQAPPRQQSQGHGGRQLPSGVLPAERLSMPAALL